MKNIKQKFSALILSFLVSAAAVLSAVPVYAASGSISLITNKAIVANGGSMVVAVYMNGGGNPINAVEADFNYPASQLQYVGISYSGSAFGIQPGGNGGGGSVTIPAGSINPITGSALIATVTFRASVGSGSAAFTIAGSSSLINANDNTAVPYGSNNDSIKFGVAAAAPAASPSAPAAPEPPAPPKDTTPPVITKVTVKSKTPYSAVIDWTTDEPSDSAIDYGLDAKYGLSASQAGSTTTHEVSLSSSFLTPKALLHYRVKSADGSGNVQTGTDQTLQLPGVPVIVVVRADNGKPQPNADVTLDNETVTSDAKGQANLTASLGSKQVVITYNGVTIRRPITVGRATKPLPPFQLDLAKQPLNHWMLTSVGLIVIVLTLLGLDLVLFGSTFVMKLVRWRWHGSPQSLAAAPVTHDTGTALFSNLDQRVDSLAPSATAAATSVTTAPPPAATPVITTHRTDLIVNDMILTTAKTHSPAPLAPIIRTDAKAIAVTSAPVMQSQPLPDPIPTPEITKQIIITETANHPAVEVAHRLKTRAASPTTSKTSKTKKSTAASGKKP
jgi:hypothetical protein